jgi:hypothetical protein
MKKILLNTIKYLVPYNLEGYMYYFMSFVMLKGKPIEAVSSINYGNKVLEYSFKQFVQHKCIFFHIPKSAGISVTLALFGNLGGGHKNAQFFKCLFAKSFSSYYKFAFVRNPYTRLVSAYEYLRKADSDFLNDKKFKENVLNKFQTFDDFVEFWLFDNFYKSQAPHFRTQFSFISLNGKVVVDFLGRYERLNDDFQKVANHLNIKTKLPTENVTVYDKQSYFEKYYYNQKTVALVQEIYKVDFEHFGYSKDVMKI